MSQPASQLTSGFRPGWLGLRLGWLGLRPGWMAQGGGQTYQPTYGKTPHSRLGLGASQPGCRLQAWLAGPQAGLAGPQDWLDGPEGGTYRRKISPFYRTLSSIGAAALLPPIKTREVEQGKGTTDHLMPLCYLFSISQISSELII